MSENRGKTHGVNCWAWGPDHYDCAVFELTRLREENARQAAKVERKDAALRAVLHWADSKCPCKNEEPDPCPLCGAGVQNLEACKAADSTLPRKLLADIRAAALTQEPAEPRALASEKEASTPAKHGEEPMFRIVERAGGFEPQMKYTSARGPECVWYPLLPTGYWAEPDAYSYGLVKGEYPLPTRDEAERAITRARLINVQAPIVALASEKEGA